MDAAVLSAIERWPNVPAVYGWLSLNARGQWCIHPRANACSGAAGETISNSQILGFIARNYDCDAKGQWFFQNGPQRAFVRLDKAPHIIRVNAQTGALETHTQQQINSVTAWYITELGEMYIDTPLGAGFIEDRELSTLMTQLSTNQQMPLDVALESLCSVDDDFDLNLLTQQQALSLKHPKLPTASPLHYIMSNDLAPHLGFVANPRSTQFDF